MIINSVIYGGSGLEVVDVGSGSVSGGYFMDQACSDPATLEKVIAKGDDAVLYRKLMNVASWSSGSDADITSTIAAAKAGSVDLTKYWSVGDTRTVRVSAMAATGVGESHVAQDIQVVLMHKNWVDANGTTHPFLWGLKDGLANGTSGEYGYMNRSADNSGGWNACSRRSWCNNVFFKALPQYLQDATGTTAVKAANGPGSSTAVSSDRCFLFNERMVFGSNTYANSTAESGISQVEWYKTSSNRVKHCGPSGSANYWWLCSPYSGNSNFFCGVDGSGGASYGYANSNLLLAPGGCIL